MKIKDKKEIVEKKKAKSLSDIIHKDSSVFLIPDIESDEGVKVNEQHKETIEYFDHQMSLIKNDDGSLNLNPLFTKIMTNIATKSTINEILHQKSSAVLLDRLMNEPGLMSNKDLIALTKLASQESTSGAKEIQSLFNISNEIKNFEAEQKLQKQKRSATLNQLDDSDRTLITSILADIQKEMEGEAKKINKKENIPMIEIEVPDEKE